MKLVTFKDKNPFENRLALFPPAIKKLAGMGIEVLIPQDYGISLELSDSIFQEPGQKLTHLKMMLPVPVIFLCE